MLLADTTNAATSLTAIVTTLDGVTTVLVAFLFVCLILPSIVRHRSQFYAALASIIGIIAVHTVMMMINTSPGILTFGGVLTGALQIIALILLVLCVGGLTVKELAGDMAKAYEVIRRGETEKETIIPIGGSQGGRRGNAGEPAGKVYSINTKPTVDDDDEDDQIPLA